MFVCVINSIFDKKNKQIRFGFLFKNCSNDFDKVWVWSAKLGLIAFRVSMSWLHFTAGSGLPGVQCSI